MDINIPELSLVVLIGASGSGKSTFAAKHFLKTEVLSSDVCRGWVSNDENNQSATDDAFDVLYYIIAKRLKNGLLTVVDATNVQPESRKGLIDLAKKYHVLPVAIVLDVAEAVCVDRNNSRPDRSFGAYVIRNQRSQLKKSLRHLDSEGFRSVHVLRSQEDVDAVRSIQRDRLYNDRRDEHGPFDIIGDVHGCLDELLELLANLGYVVCRTDKTGADFGYQVEAPENRKLVFVGDLVDRGPDSAGVLRLVMSMVQTGVALCVPGNHDFKLQKYLSGKKVTLNHGLDTTVEQLGHESPEFVKAVGRFLYSLVSHYVLDGGKLVVAHAGLKEEMQGRGSGAVRSFCMFGETTGETDEFGLPVRYEWAKEYRGKAKVVYGHTPVVKTEWLNNTIDIDTGCVFGGKLSALRYPEEAIVSVDAKRMYYEPKRPLAPVVQDSALSSQQEYDDVLNIEDVTGKRIVQTSLRNNITISEESSIAALEVMSRFAVDPKWLIYLPPTMSPCATSVLPDYLEYPTQAMDYYRRAGVEKLVCEVKHMGSRAVVIVCKDKESAQYRFGVSDGSSGVCYTRTGRAFFNDSSLEVLFLDRIRKCLNAANFWEQFGTDWFCFDAEILPWSAKAQSLLRDQYAAVSSAAHLALPVVVREFEKSSQRGVAETTDLLARARQSERSLAKYTKAYRSYCWSVRSIDDFKFAPFHLLATEGTVHSHQSHLWHMETLAELCRYDEGMLRATPYRVVDIHNEESCGQLESWWLELTAHDAEGIVLKPFDFISKAKDELVQPAVKCRGREYLRIIYGPEYNSAENLERLKKRSLTRKQSLALREFALGIESLERFVRREPLRRIHESAFAVLALESESVDPRL